ncbi:MAG TPA: hypothetical protein VGO00_19315 [Kofleriaceae bacterium]|nr:hypothetical protein [Kofleriaceae bacterium]
MRHAVIPSGILFVSLLAGCPDREIAKVTPDQGRVETKDIPVTPRRDIDILFLIDDSPSMADKQNNLAMNFPNFINVLNTIEGGLPNVHIGVTTSDMGTKGAADSAPGPAIGSGPGSCSGSGKNGNLQIYGAPLTAGDVFISDIKNADGTRMQNYTGNLADVFTVMAKAGATGCGFEQHLEGAKHALNNNPANAGFVRPDAFLAIIFIQDEDDCSIAHSSLLGNDSSLGPLQSMRCTRFGVLCDVNGQTTDQMNSVGTKDQCHPNDNSQYLTKVGDYVDFFKSLKSDPKDVLVAGVSGTVTPFQIELRPPPGSQQPIPALAHSCNYTDTAGGLEVADPPVRLKFFLDQFPDRSTFTTICQQDLSDGLTLIANLLKTVIGSPCVDGKLAMPYDCSVSYITNEGKPNQMETVLPECNNTTDPTAATNKPCWDIQTDAMNCSGADHLTLKVQDTGTPPPNTNIVSNCVTVAQ